MIASYSPIIQALLGSLFTWAVTGCGASLVFLFKRENLLLLDASLGFAAGVMLAASFWSLISPALEITEKDYGSFGFVPIAFGFILGGVFVYASEKIITKFGFIGFTPLSKNHHGNALLLANGNTVTDPSKCRIEPSPTNEDCASVNIEMHGDNGATVQPSMSNGDCATKNVESSPTNGGCATNNNNSEPKRDDQISADKYVTMKRVSLLILAITMHNIPEGLAVGVGFGAVGKTASATFENARNLALGIGIQNFPEGFAVSLPLLGLGYSKWKCFWYGQLSGFVEPIAALLGALAIRLMEPLLPYALSFAAGAMIFVVLDDIVPEGQKNTHGKVASWMAMLGFVVMMALDVGFG